MSTPGDFELNGGIAKQLKRNDQGLVPAIAQAESGEVLMMAWMMTTLWPIPSPPARQRIFRARAMSIGLRERLLEIPKRCWAFALTAMEILFC